MVESGLNVTKCELVTVLGRLNDIDSKAQQTVGALEADAFAMKSSVASVVATVRQQTTLPERN